MSYNGSGTFNINSTGQPVVTGTVISSSVFNALTADLATGLSTCITKDGQTTVTANIPMNSFKFTNLAAGTAAGDSVRVSQLQAGSATSLTVTGTNTYAATASPALTAYTTGNTFSFVVPNSNTSSCTLNIDSLGAKAITRDGTTALVSGDLVAGSEVLVVYDGTQFQVVNSNSKTNFNVSTLLKATTLNLTNALGTSYGGTGLTSFTSGGVVYASSSSALATGSALTFDGTLLTQGNLRLETGSGYAGLNTTTNVPFIFYLNNTEQMRLNSTGLGIGTSSPAYKLDVSTSGTAAARFVGAANVYADVTDGTGNFRIQLLSNVPNIGSSTNHNLNLITNNSVKATLDTSGNLGLGVTPSAWYSTYKALQISSNGSLSTNTDFFAFSNNAYTNASGNDIYLTSGYAGRYRHVASSGIHAWYTAPSGTAGNAITFTQAMTLNANADLSVGGTGVVYSTSGRGNVTINGSSSALLGHMVNGVETAYLNATATAYSLVAVTNIPMVFYTNSTEAARIDSSGNLLVGTTNASPTALGFRIVNSATIPQVSVAVSATSNNYLLYNTTAAAYRFFVSDAGQINATSTSITGISDISLKENIRDLETGLLEVMALKPRRFDWKKETQIAEKNVAGFIAQEVETVLPELVYDYQYNADETKKALKMGDILPTLVKAMQEQQKLIETLTARVAQLEGK